MKLTLPFFIAIAALGFAACSSAPSNQSVNTGNVAVNSVTAPPPTSNTAASNRSPMETLRALNAASKAKDVSVIKNLVSNGTLQLMEKSAQNQNKSVDEILTADDGAPFNELPEMRDEKINGETATVEIKNAVTKEFEKIPFVRENGEWKLALDVLVQEFERKATEAMKDAPDKKTDDTPTNTENKSGKK